MTEAVMPVPTPATGDAVDASQVVEVAKPPGIFRVALGMWRTRIGLIITASLVFIAFFGRYFAPYGENEGIGVAMKPASELEQDSLFGSGELGRDIWTRFLYGGRPILITAVLATLLALLLGTIVGLLAAYSRGVLDDILMRTMDVLISLPQIILVLVVVSMFGVADWKIILAVALSTTPRIARVTRGSAVSVVERDFVGAAEALGEPRWRILAWELLPNITAPLLVEATLRLTYTIALIGALAFLGFTSDPLAANWGLMIQEHRGGLLGDQPWGTVLPVIAIALLTIGTGLIGDGLSRAAAGIDRARGGD
jgi:peptide/nickel transport system permease protein